MIGHGAGCAPTVVGGEVAAGDIGVLNHAVEAHVQHRAYSFIDINRTAPGGVAQSSLHGGVIEVGVLGFLGDDVQRAAGGAASSERRSRAAQNLHLLVVEVL